MAKHRTNHRRMIAHVPHHRPRRSSTQNRSGEIECRDRLGQGLPGRDRTLRRWCRYCREVDNIGLPAGANDAERAPPCAGESEPRPPAVTLSATSADVPPPQVAFSSAVVRLRQPTRSRSITYGRAGSARCQAKYETVAAGGRGRPCTEAYERERRRRGRGWVALMADVVIGLTHVITHLGQLQVTSDRRMAGSRGRPSDGDGPRRSSFHGDRFPHRAAEGEYGGPANVIDSAAVRLIPRRRMPTSWPPAESVPVTRAGRRRCTRRTRAPTGREHAGSLGPPRDGRAAQRWCPRPSRVRAKAPGAGAAKSGRVAQGFVRVSVPPERPHRVRRELAPVKATSA